MTPDSPASVVTDKPRHIGARVVQPGMTYASVTDKISSIVLTRPVDWKWLLGFGISFLATLMMLGAISYLLVIGVGVWGIDIPVAWGFAIVNFVWWIGIGHAGTLISAILLLLRQDWRTSINRFAEAMTIFAVGCAALFPLLHLGRPSRFYWLLPYPNTMGLWPQWRSPLVWDVFAVSTYATVSLIFFYVGLVPDLATLRDRSTHKFGQVVYGLLALGWRGSAVHWKRYQKAYVLLAALATPLVISVHSIVGLDFAVAIVPGWHNTLFPPYFVAGAIYSGFAMVLTLTIPLRSMYGLQGFITDKHLDNMAKVMLGTGLMVAYGYAMEAFMTFYSGSQYESYMMFNRATGAYAPQFWLLLTCNIFIPQLLWFRKVRLNVPLLFVISLVVNVGMWLERYIIVVTSLHRDYMPSAWGMYAGTKHDWMLFIGTIGLFIALVFLFIRFLPMIATFEMRELLHGQAQDDAEEAH